MPEDANADAHVRSKKPRAVVAGPYGHPFHPILVTIPIGTWLASAVFDVVGFTAEDAEPFVIGAVWLIAIGLVGAVFAALAGLIDLSNLSAGTSARRTALVHMTLNLSAMVVLCAGLAVRLASGDDEVSVLGFILSLVALAALGMSGWLGGKLAYRYGIRVADEATQAEGFRDRSA